MKYDPTEAFRQLSDPDPAIRLVGAKWVSKQAHAEVNAFTEPWLGHPSTMDRLLLLLHDPDPLVVEQIVGAVYMIVWRYRRDERPAARAIELLSSPRAGTRKGAALVLITLGDERAATQVLSLFDDPDKSVRAVVVHEIADPVGRWSPAMRERVRLAALARLQDRSTDVRCEAARLLACVGRGEDLPTLRQGLKDIKGANYRQDYREALKDLEKAQHDRE